jgi:hypothetical protein
MQSNTFDADDGALSPDVDAEVSQALKCASWVGSIEQTMDFGASARESADHERPVRY